TPMSMPAGWWSWSTPAIRSPTPSTALTRSAATPNRRDLMPSFLDFEKPIAELQGRIDELRETAADGAVDIGPEVARLQAKSDKLLRDTYARLTPWQKTQVAR